MISIGVRKIILSFRIGEGRAGRYAVRGNLVCANFPVPSYPLRGSANLDGTLFSDSDQPQLEYHLLYYYHSPERLRWIARVFSRGSSDSATPAILFFSIGSCFLYRGDPMVKGPLRCSSPLGPLQLVFKSCGHGPFSFTSDC